MARIAASSSLTSTSSKKRSTGARSLESAVIAEVAPRVTYGWGMIPARVQVGGTEVTTSLWPKDGGYIVPVKKALQDAEGLELGDLVEVRLRLAV